MSDLRNISREDMERFRQTPRTFGEGVHFPTSYHSDVGPSNYHSNSSYSYHEPLRNSKDLNGANRALPELDQAELLRQIDELKARLSQSFDVVDKPKENIPFCQRIAPLETYEGADSWFPNGSLRSLGSDNPTAGSTCYGNSPDAFHYPAERDITGNGCYQVHHPSNVPGYGDPFGSQVLRGTQNQFACEYQTQATHPYFSGQHIDTKQVPFMPYGRSSLFHHSSCSCYHCHEKHHQGLASVASTAFSNNRFPDSPNSQELYHFENPGVSGVHVHNLRSEMAPSRNLLGTQAYARWPSNVNFKMSDSEQFPHHRLVVTSAHRFCCPIVGGAPFLICRNCFELLKLPRKLKPQGKTGHKLRCGACSNIMKFAIINKKFVVLDNVEASRVPTKVDETSTAIEKENFHEHVGRIGADSDDYDNSGYDFQAMDMEPVPQPKGQAINSVEPQEMRCFLSSSSSMSDNDNSLDGLTTYEEALNSFQEQIKTHVSPSPPASPFQDHSDYSSNDSSLNQFGNGNRSHQSDPEKGVSSKVATRQNSLKEALIVSEIDVAYDPFLNVGGSQDSTDATRENDQFQKTKGSDSLFTNTIKKSFKDFSRSNHAEEGGKGNVSVNEQSITELDVKKAEKLAGPIKPGKYWYDFRAGFWGVMYGPCLGIIPPFIEEFNYPMPENCAGGNTGVLVNGRELHQKDLDLLASRGLPTDRGRSYIIEISGRVLDEESGEELGSLGKLAPTIERVKHGFGMKPPRRAA